jgi:ATP-dependent Lon protease
MTGEITLRGRVLPIGGLKSKILAAHLSGARMVIIPAKNEKDIRDIPDEIRKQIKLVLVDSMEQVLDAALRRKPARLSVTPAEVVDADRKPDDRPTAPDKITRGFPPAEQPPAVAGPAAGESA